MINEERKVRPEIVNVNSKEPVCFLFSIRTRKYSLIWNNINDSCAKRCVPDVVKNLNAKSF